jgi:hypothetical protein
MSDRPKQRRPATFRLDDPGVVLIDADEAGKAARGTVQITPEPDPAQLPIPVEAPAVPRRAFGWTLVADFTSEMCFTLVFAFATFCDWCVLRVTFM